MTREPVYLDNAATTAALPEVVETMRNFLSRQYGNPASSHGMGVAAARAMDEAAAALAASIGAGPWETVFTSSGTEANNLALLGTAGKRRGASVVTTAIEHASVLEPLTSLVSKGMSLALVRPGEDGRVRAADVLAAVDDKTCLVSVQHANNELGTLQPVDEVGALLKKLRPGVILHVDAVQTAGKTDLDAAARWADLVTLSAHKVHGPKGVGALLIRKDAPRPAPLIRGGGQQGGLRSGTENVPGAAGFALAVKLAAERIAEHAASMKALEEAFDEGFREIAGARRLLGASPHLPGFIVVAFPRIPSEVVEHAMEAEGFIVSSTAACSSRKPKRSHVLEAIGIPEDTHVIRVVPSRFTARDDMAAAAAALSRVLGRLG
jgi:cysteine desulfurase